MNKELENTDLTSNDAKPVLGDDFADVMDMQSKIIDELIKNTDNAVKKYLIDNLKQFGYHFNHDEAFINFCKERITRIAFEEKPYYYEFYLDFIGSNDKGICIGSYSDKIEIINEGNKITAVIGKDFA